MQRAVRLPSGIEHSRRASGHQSMAVRCGPGLGCGRPVLGGTAKGAVGALRRMRGGARAARKGSCAERALGWPWFIQSPDCERNARGVQQAGGAERRGLLLCSTCTQVNSTRRGRVP